MLSKLFAVAFLPAAVFSVAFVGAEDVKEAKPKSCCEQQLKCCKPQSACCVADVKLGCCEKGQKCCAEKRDCCVAVQKCCQTGSACCEQQKACCGPAAKQEVSLLSGEGPACCSAKKAVASCCGGSGGDAAVAEIPGQSLKAGCPHCAAKVAAQ